MSFFYPDYKFDSMMQITPDDLRNMGVEGVAVDLDNTTAHDHTDKPIEGAIEWIEEMRNAGFKVMILSNGKKYRAESFAKLLGNIEFVGVALKPLIVAYIKGQKTLKLRPRKIAMIGDQLFTDILGANLAGWKSIYVTPYAKEERDVKSFEFRRNLEKKIFARMDKKQRRTENKK